MFPFPNLLELRVAHASARRACFCVRACIRFVSDACATHASVHSNHIAKCSAAGAADEKGAADSGAEKGAADSDAGNEEEAADGGAEASVRLSVGASGAGEASEPMEKAPPKTAPVPTTKAPAPTKKAPAPTTKAPEPTKADKVTGKSKPIAKVATKPNSKKNCKPHWSNERTRNQILCRTGLSGPGQSRAFKYGSNGKSIGQAIDEAEAWVKSHK